MNGPGKYDAECTAAREATGATGCLLMVLGGARGNGFSFQTADEALVQQVPAMLEAVAQGIRAELLKAANS